MENIVNLQVIVQCFPLPTFCTMYMIFIVIRNVPQQSQMQYGFLNLCGALLMINYIMTA